MKRLFHALVMCQSMFCSLPCPCRIWNEKARPLMLLFLPVIGLEIGVLWWLLAWGCSQLSLPQPVSALLLSVFPYLITGFIHLDGFMDVTDALGSCRKLEDRRAILKDSHVGAFAVIGCALLLLAGFALHWAAGGDIRILIFIPVVSRCCSALAVVTLRPISVSQYAGAFREGVTKLQPAVLAGILAITASAGFLLCGKYGFALLAGAVVSILALRKGFQALDGMNGDISGYALTLSELAAAAVYAMI